MRHYQLKFVFIFILIIFINITSFAATVTAGAMLLFGTGQMGNSSDVAQRSMVYTPVELFAGYNIRPKFRMGLNYEYNLAGQSADPASVGNQNIGGKGSVIGLRFDYYNGIQSAGLIYHVSSKYILDKPTIGGTVADYDGKSGFSFQYYRQIKKKIGFVIDYTSSEMKSSAANTSDIKWDRVSLGLVFTNFGK